LAQGTPAARWTARGAEVSRSAGAHATWFLRRSGRYLAWGTRRGQIWEAAPWPLANRASKGCRKNRSRGGRLARI